MRIKRKVQVPPGIPFEHVKVGEVFYRAAYPEHGLWLRVGAPRMMPHVQGANIDDGSLGSFPEGDLVVVVDGAFVEGAE